MVSRLLSPWRRRALIGLYVVGALGTVPALIFGLHVYRVRTSPFIMALQRDGAAYPCIGERLFGERLFPRRSNARPALPLARHYLLGGKSGEDSLRWRFEFVVTPYAFEALFSRQEMNRMYAALPIGGLRGFDGIALAVWGRRYCDLNEREKDVVREFSRSGSREKLRALIAAIGAA